MRGKGKGNLFPCIPSQQNNTAEQSKEIRLFNEFYFNMVEKRDFTLAALKNSRTLALEKKS